MSGQSTPHSAAGQQTKKRLSSNLSHHLRNVSLTNGSRSHDNVLASLRETQFLSFRPALPAELMNRILDYMTMPDLMRFARASRRMQEMVYEDTRWVQKLQAMKAWNEVEARQRVEQAMRKRMNLPDSNPMQTSNEGQSGTQSGRMTTMLFDAGVEEERRQNTIAQAKEQVTTTKQSNLHMTDSTAALNAFKNVRSVRGFARQEFAKVYVALAPLYMDLVRSHDHTQAQVFRLYRDPEHQALILANLHRFAQGDSAFGGVDRESRLHDITSTFETAILHEFELGYSARDVEGRMQRYAHVLATLNGGTAAVYSFISRDPLILRTMRLGNPLDCLEGVATGHVDLNPSRAFFERLSNAVIEKAGIAVRAFPASVDVLTPFLRRLVDNVINDYITTLLDEAHKHGTETYVKAVSGTFEQALRFVAVLEPIVASSHNFMEDVRQAIIHCYEPHVERYLAEELNVFKARSQAEVMHWEKELADQQTSTETFFMSNINRQAAKRDFLSSFKKVVMMPVNVIPSFGTSKAAAAPATTNLAPVDSSDARSRTPLSALHDQPRPGTPQLEAPTDELAAKTAIMNSRLEGIRSLFSLDVALNLTHLAKACLDRTAAMVQMGGAHGRAAREQCDTVFVTLLDVLGDRHIKSGFDKAVEHLSEYNPSEVRKSRRQKVGENGEQIVHAPAGVAPLVTFLELVNIGDLIQQMIDVFYNQELVSKKLVDRDDFMDPAVKEKKRFEQMLDERVAAGLNKGIDVLVDEIEYIFASTQVSTDYNPGGGGSQPLELIDIGPTSTAVQVVDMVKSHTSMLIGSTDKNMLDVFMQEVGLRLFGALCKHFKRQRISVEGAIKLISDINLYSEFVGSLRQKSLAPYFHALRELAQIYLVYVEPPATYFGGSQNAKNKRGSVMSMTGSNLGQNVAGKNTTGKGSAVGIAGWGGGGKSTTSQQAKELASIIADHQKYRGVLSTQEVYEFVERRADWYLIKSDVERAMYGVGCIVM